MEIPSFKYVSCESLNKRSRTGCVDVQELILTHTPQYLYTHYLANASNGLYKRFSKWT